MAPTRKCCVGLPFLKMSAEKQSQNRFMYQLLKYVEFFMRPRLANFMNSSMVTSLKNHKERSPYTKEMLVKKLETEFNDEINKFSKKGDLHLLYEQLEQEVGEETDDGYIMWDSNTLADRKHMHRVANALASWQFGMPVIVDMWYNQSHQDLNVLTMAIKETIERNLDFKEPFFIHFTDIQIGSQSEKAVRQVLEQDCDYLQAFHVKSCVDMFPKSRLIYLTPYCLRFVTTMEVNEEAHIFIIGGLVDDSRNRLSVKRVRHLGVEARCFYRGHKFRGLDRPGSILSIANSLHIMHELQLGKSHRHSINFFRSLEKDSIMYSSKVRQHAQSVLEY